MNDQYGALNVCFFLSISNRIYRNNVDFVTWRNFIEWTACEPSGQEENEMT